MPYCKTGKHLWLDIEDAARCCNGYLRVTIPFADGCYLAWMDWNSIRGQEVATWVDSLAEDIAYHHGRGESWPWFHSTHNNAARLSPALAALYDECSE